MPAIRSNLKAREPDKLVLLLHKPDGCDVLGGILKEAIDCDIVSVSEMPVFDSIVRNCHPDLIVLDLAFAPDLADRLSGLLGNVIGRSHRNGGVPAIGITRRDLPAPLPKVRERFETVLMLPFHREQFLEAAVQCLRTPLTMET